MKLRILLHKATFFYLKLVTFNKPVCLNMTIDGTIHVDNKGGYVAGCTFHNTKNVGLWSTVSSIAKKRHTCVP
jgi:hypothetical protein